MFSLQENCTTVDEEKDHLVIFPKLKEETHQNSIGAIAPLVRIDFPLHSSYLNFEKTVKQDCNFVGKKNDFACFLSEAKKTPTPVPHPRLPPVVTPPPLCVGVL